MSVREIIRLLEQNGWELRRTNGSHRQFKHPAKPGLVTVAGHLNQTLKPKTLASICKQAGIKR